MTQSSSEPDKLYRGTPYLEDLQKQLGGTLTEIVQAEVHRFKKVKQNLQTKIKESDGEAPQARKKLKQMPAALRHTGAYVAGPHTLPRGETAHLPLILRKNDGGECVVGHFAVHTMIGGAWQMVGYDGNNGQPEDLRREVHPYEPDDLEHAMGKVDSFMKTIDQVAGGYIQLDEKRSSTSVGAASLVDGNVTSGVEAGLPLEENTAPEPSSSGSESSESTTEKIKSKASRILGASSVEGETLIRNDVGRKNLNSEEVIDRIMQENYRHASPRWFQKLKDNRLNKDGSKTKRWRKFASIATKVYNKMLELDDWDDARTINEFWTILGRYCKKGGIMSKDYCWTTSQKINLDENGRCKLRHQCPKAKLDENRRCKNQSVAK